MKTLALLALALAGADYPVSPDLRPDYFDTIQEAAIAGVALSYQRSNAYEFAGTIYRTPSGKFRISDPDTDYSGDSVELDFKNDYDTYKLAGWYHTHPCLPYSHWVNAFSDNDTNTSLRRDVPGYMGDLCSGAVRQFVPKVDALDICWDTDNRILDALTALLNTFQLVPTLPAKNDCGSHGTIVGQIKIDRLPVMQETPGPITKAKGMKGW